MKKTNKLNNKGFTLMELIIVVAIMAILIALIAPNLVGFLDTATDTSYDANAKSCYTAASAWATQQRIAGTLVDGQEVVTKDTDAGEGTLGEALGVKNFGDGTAKITFDKGKCTKVEWDADSDNTADATYPKE